MSVRPLRYLGDPILRTPSDKITRFDAALARIIEVSGDADGPEACLSIPGVTAVRHRSATAIAVGLNLDQQQVVVSGTGELARVLQHETGHLKGELFIDGLSDDERRRVMRQIYADQIASGPPGPERPSE